MFIMFYHVLSALILVISPRCPVDPVVMRRIAPFILQALNFEVFWVPLLVARDQSWGKLTGMPGAGMMLNGWKPRPTRQSVDAFLPHVALWCHWARLREKFTMANHCWSTSYRKVKWSEWSSSVQADKFAKKMGKAALDPCHQLAMETHRTQTNRARETSNRTQKYQNYSESEKVVWTATWKNEWRKGQKNAKELFLIHIPGAAMGASSLWTKEREAVPSLQSRVPFATRYTVYTILIHFTPQLLGLLYFLLKLRNYEEWCILVRFILSVILIPASKMFKAYTADLLLQPKMPGFGLSKTLADASWCQKVYLQAMKSLMMPWWLGTGQMQRQGGSSVGFTFCLTLPSRWASPQLSWAKQKGKLHQVHTQGITFHDMVSQDHLKSRMSQRARCLQRVACHREALRSCLPANASCPSPILQPTGSDWGCEVQMWRSVVWWHAFLACGTYALLPADEQIREILCCFRIPIPESNRIHREREREIK